MNKLLILFLAVCLVSVHAFVKRDAPKTEEPLSFDDLQKAFQTQFEELSKKTKEAFDPEVMKARLNDMVNELNKAFNPANKDTAGAS